MLAMLLVILISAGNFCLGFFLAIYFGHGPMHLPLVRELANKLHGH